MGFALVKEQTFYQLRLAELDNYQPKLVFVLKTHCVWLPSQPKHG